MKATAIIIPKSAPERDISAVVAGADSVGVAVPHILHIDRDSSSALALAALLTPEARVTHVPTLAGARALLQQHIFSAVVIDPDLPDGDAAELLPVLTAIPLLVYSARQPSWRERSGVYLAKPWATPRQLWTTIAKLLGIANPTCAGA
ncbi:MAG: response regulator [Pseudomonadota bacterium]